MKKLFFFALLIIMASSCTMKNVGMMNANTELQLRKFDLDISNQYTTSLTVTRIFGIDFSRLFNKEMANFDRNGATMMPILGLPVATPAIPDQQYALSKLIAENKATNFDMILYPKFEMKNTNLIIVRKTDVKVTARFATLKSE